MVVMDTSMLLLLLRPDVDAPLDPSTGKPVEAVQERISYLVNTLEKSKTKIIIPTPALSELLVRAGSAGNHLLQQINKLSVFRIVPFDQIAAVEVAAMTRAAIDAGDKRSGVDAPWAKVKYDRQIVAIARVVQATTIYSDDGDMEALAKEAGIDVIKVSDLPLPPFEAQGKLQLEPPEVEGPYLGDDEDSEISEEALKELRTEADEEDQLIERDEDDEPSG